MPNTVPIVREVAAHFTAEEVRKGKEWEAAHAHELPKTESGRRVFPDAIQKKMARELQRITEKRRRNITLPRKEDDLDIPDDSDDDAAEFEPADDSLADAASLSFNRSREIMARVEAAAVVAQHAPRRERSADRFMATTDEYVEPYFAVRDGMSLGEAARKFNVPDMNRYMLAIEEWLSALEVGIPNFDRNRFLSRLERAVSKRRKDAVRIDTVYIPARELRVRKSHANSPAIAVQLRPQEASPATTNPPGCSLRTPETDRALAKARTTPPTPDELRNRQLERGLIALLELNPYGPQTLELVRIADMTKEGKSQRDIASALGMDRRKVSQRLELILKAGEISPCFELKVRDELTRVERVLADSVSGSGSAGYAEKCTSRESPAVYV